MEPNGQRGNAKAWIQWDIAFCSLSCISYEYH